MSLTVPPLSALPPPSVPPLPTVIEPPMAAAGTPLVREVEQAGRARAGWIVLLAALAVVVVAACWALGARLIGPDAWVAVIGLGVVPCGVAALRGPR